MGILKKPKKKKEPYMEYHRGFLNVDHLGFTRRFLIIAPYHPQRWWSYGVNPFHVWCMLHLKTSPSGGPTCGGLPWGSLESSPEFFWMDFFSTRICGSPRRSILVQIGCTGLELTRHGVCGVWLFGVNWMWWKIPQMWAFFSLSTYIQCN